MTIQYCSYLHLEFLDNRKWVLENPIIPKGDILILAGDIVLFKEIHQHQKFFDYVSSHFEHTFWIPGNPLLFEVSRPQTTITYPKPDFLNSKIAFHYYSQTILLSI